MGFDFTRVINPFTGSTLANFNLTRHDQGGIPFVQSTEAHREYDANQRNMQAIQDMQAVLNSFSPKPTGNSGGSNVTSNVTGGGGVNYYTGGSTGYTAPAYDPKVVAQYDQSIGLLNDALGRNSTQLGIAKSNIGKQYNTRVNELNSSKAQNQKTYDTSSTQNQQSLRTNRNAIMDQQSAGLRSLLRQLGAYGAVGSDMQVASGAVADVASQQNAGAGQTFAQNQQGLDTNWNNYLSEWANSKKKVADWRSQQLQSAEAQSLSARQDILSQLADLRGQRAAAVGGGYADAAAPDLSRARGLSSRIDSLGRINPTYNGKTPIYNAPELSSYATPQTQQVDASALNNSTTANPGLLALLTQQDQRENQF